MVLVRSRSWNVNEVEFYSDSECSGEKHDSGEYIESNHLKDWTNDKAFDGATNTYWAGKWDNRDDKQFFIGMKFDKATKVLCVKFKDDDSNRKKSTEKVKVQALDDETGTWIDIVEETHTYGKWETVSLSSGTPVPTASPTQTRSCDDITDKDDCDKVNSCNWSDVEDFRECIINNIKFEF